MEALMLKHPLVQNFDCYNRFNKTSRKFLKKIHHNKIISSGGKRLFFCLNYKTWGSYEILDDCAVDVGH